MQPEQPADGEEPEVGVRPFRPGHERGDHAPRTQAHPRQQGPGTQGRGVGGTHQ